MKYKNTLILILALTSACSMPVTQNLSETGSINLSINNSNSRTLAPDISLDAVSYEITGSGPEGASFFRTTTALNSLVEDLNPGNWTISIEALNAQSMVIGLGAETVAVSAGSTSSVNISVLPLEGPGTLNLSILYQPADLANPVMSGILRPSAGNDIDLVFTATTVNTFTFSQSIEAGYYTLILQLLDSTTVVMGTVETVHVVAGQTTTGTFDFTDVNSIGGSIDININVDLNTPVVIALTGNLNTLPYSSSMTVSASAPQEAVTINYTWYLNGSPVGTGSAVSIGSTLNPGVYRLDVIAITADGSRSGSFSHSFTVTNP